jgi:hypothetical protein
LERLESIEAANYFAPAAIDDLFTFNEDTVFTTTSLNGVLANDTDADGDPLTAALVTPPAVGELVFNEDGSFTYTPAANWHGTVQFAYRAFDGEHWSELAWVTLVVNPVNDQPIAVDDYFNGAEGGTVLGSVLDNDLDVDGDTLTVSLVSGPSHGILQMQATGSFTYTPSADWHGDDSFVYGVSDGVQDSIATVHLTIDAVGDSPDAPTVTVEADTPTLSESSEEAAHFQIRRTGDLNTVLVVSHRVTGNAKPNWDYNAFPVFSVFSPGQDTVDLPLIPIDDPSDEEDEAVRISVMASDDYNLGSQSSAVITLLDDASDQFPVVSIGVIDEQAAESPNENALIAVTRTGLTDQALAVQIAFAGTATVGQDYATLPESVIIPAGQQSITLPITPLDDVFAEVQETVVPYALPSPHYDVGESSGEVVLLDGSQDSVPIISITPLSSSSEDPEQPATFFVSRTGSLETSIVVHYQMTGIATSGPDYVAPSGVITLPQGEIGQYLAIDIVDDLVADPNEFLVVELLQQSNYALDGSSAAMAMIHDNEPIVFFSDGPYAVDESDTDGILLTLARTGPLDQSLIVAYTVTGSAQSAADYVALSGEVTFAPQQHFTSITVTPLLDTTAEGHDTVQIALAASAAYGLVGWSEATVNIIDDDLGPTVTVESLVSSIAENAPLTGAVRFERDGDISNELRVQLEAVGLARIGADYFLQDNSGNPVENEVTFSAGVSQITLSIAPTVDIFDEGTEPVLVKLLDTPHYELGAASEATLDLLEAGGNAPAIRILDAISNDITGTTKLRIGRWQDTAFTHRPETPANEKYYRRPLVHNDFIARDDDHFLVQVRDAARNVNPAEKDRVSIYVSTDNLPGGLQYNDDPTEVELLETGIDTGVFESNPMLLVSDVVDDRFEVTSDANGQQQIVPDNMKNEGTHMIALGGHLRANYADQPFISASVPVQKTVHLHPMILREAKGKDPVITVAEVELEIAAARERYASAGIYITYDAVSVVDPPAGVDLLGKVHPLHEQYVNKVRYDGIRQGPSLLPKDLKPGVQLKVSDEERALLTTLRSQSTEDIEVYYVNYLTKEPSLIAGKTSYSPSEGTSYVRGYVPKEYQDSIVVAARMSSRPYVINVLAHEIGHMFSSPNHYDTPLPFGVAPRPEFAFVNLMSSGGGQDIQPKEVAPDKVVPNPQVTDSRRISAMQAREMLAHPLARRPM